MTTLFTNRVNTESGRGPLASVYNFIVCILGVSTDWNVGKDQQIVALLAHNITI